MKHCVAVALLLLALPARAHQSLADGVKDLATQISATATRQSKQKIAILPFHELDGQPTILGTYVAEELVTNLVQLVRVHQSRLTATAPRCDERGNRDYVTSFSDLRGKWRISSETAISPKWSADGNQFFFVSHRSLNVADVRGGSPPEFSMPSTLPIFIGSCCMST